MIKQTDPRCGYVRNHFGCYLFDLLKIAQDARGEDWDFEKVDSIYKGAIAAKLVGYLVGEVFYPGENLNPLDGCFVENALGVLELAGCPACEILQGPLGAGMWPMDSKIPDKTAIIQKWHNDRTSFNHYVVGNPDGTCKWDPISRPNGLGSVTVEEGHPVSMRLIQFL